MATLPLFSENTPDKQTDDSDASRLNDYPSIVRDNDGRLILFYEKEFKSGLISGGIVTFVDPSLNCQVTAGTGEINETLVSWSGDILSLTPSTYSLIYVDIFGNVGSTDDYPISFVKSVIILAYVSVGETSIVRVNPVEKTGLYIFSRRQVLLGPDYVWDDYEYRLNVGGKPEAVFDSSTNKAYCTFIKDGATYIRVFDTTSELTWEDLRHVEEVSDVLYPSPQPKESMGVNMSTLSGVITSYQPPLYEIARSMPVGLERDSTVAYVHLPYISSSYISAAIPPLQMEVFSKDGTNYVLENTFTLLSAERSTQLETLWTDTTGMKYLGLRIQHTLYGGDFLTDPSDYLTTWIPDTLDYHTLSDDTHNVQIFPEIYPANMATSLGDYTTSAEYDQFYRFPSDDMTNVSMAASLGDYTTSAEYDQFYRFPSDDMTSVSMAVSIGVQTIT